MADGRETRAAIDTETVRGLLLINGGGAVALLAFLSTIIDKPYLAFLARFVVIATFSFQLGLVTAVIHNRLRRICSMAYATKAENRKACTLFGKRLKEPCICHWSTGFMWASICSFLVAGILVLVAGMTVVRDQNRRIDPSAEVSPATALVAPVAPATEPEEE